MNLRTRLYLGLTGLVLAAVLSAGWLVLRIERAQSYRAYQSRVQTTAQALGAVIERDLTPSSLQPLIQEWVARGAIKSGIVIGERTQTLAAAGTEATSDALLLTARGAPLLLRRNADVVVYLPLGRGAARFVFGEAEEIAVAQRSAESLLVAVTLIDAGLVLLFGVLYLRRVIGPLAELSARARQVASGDLQVPPLRLPGRRDEIAQLCEDFSRMTESLRSQHEHLVAQEKLVTVGRLAAGVAHEIGNPLAAILGYTELLRSSSAATNASELTDRIRQQIERIQRIVSDLLAYARPISPVREPVSLQQAVAGALSLLTPQQRFSAVQVELKLPLDLPPCRARSDRVIQVLINLLLNAADAMAGRGAVQIEAVQRDGQIELSVQDSGPGVAEPDRNHIFDPFFTTKDPGQGTGLGLSISRSIAQALGGDLRLAPSERGARFVLSLPAA